MKLDYLEMLHAEFEVSSLNSMALREILRWAKKICDNNGQQQRTTTTDATGKLNTSLSRERELTSPMQIKGAITAALCGLANLDGK